MLSHGMEGLLLLVNILNVLKLSEFVLEIIVGVMERTFKLLLDTESCHFLQDNMVLFLHVFYIINFLWLDED